MSGQGQRAGPETLLPRCSAGAMGPQSMRGGASDTRKAREMRSRRGALGAPILATATAPFLLLLCCGSHLLSGAAGQEVGGVEPFEPGRLSGKVAAAEFGELTGGQLTGTIEFAQCVDDGVFVKVNIVDAVSGINCLKDPTQDPCLYQINNVHLTDEALQSNDISSCGTVDDIFDPISSGAQGWSTDPEDICSSTQSSALGRDSKILSCPVGGLSRKWGVLRSYFDDSLRAFNNIIGLSVLLYRLDAQGNPVVYGCAPLVFKDNCNADEKNALLAFREGLDSGADLLPSWVPENDMCDGFFGVRCEGQGRVAHLLLQDTAALREAALEHLGLMGTEAPLLQEELLLEGSINVTALLPIPGETPRGVLAFPDGSDAPLSEQLVGTLPAEFSSMSATKTIQMNNHELYGPLPSSWSQLSELRTLNLSSNNITGTLLPEWEALLQLRLLDLSSNELVGELPSEWSTLVQVEDLNLNGNRLVGTVPNSWSSLGTLNYLDLSGNDDLCDAQNVLNATESSNKDLCSTVPRPPPPPQAISGGSPSPITMPTQPSSEPKQEDDDGNEDLDAGMVAGIVVAVILGVVVTWFASRWCHVRSLGAAGTAPTPGGREASAMTPGGDPKAAEDVYVHIPESSSLTDYTANSFSNGGSNGPHQGGTTPSSSKRQEPRGSFSPPKSIPAVGSASPELKALAYCASGTHPLDFSQADTVEAAVVDRSCPLGSGGYGVVYRGTLLREGKLLDVAVKVISNSDSQELHASKYKSFEDEVSTLSLFQGTSSSDCIVKVYDWVLEYPRAMIFYEYLENDTLARLVHKRKQKLNYLELLQMGYGVAEGLAALHAKNVIHRDLKPDNILLDSHMRPRLTDFGISRQKQDPSASSITTHNIGTWIYMAPEQFNGRLSEKSDVYSLGMVLWECWCNERPWSSSYGDDMEIWQVMYRLIHENDRPLIPGSCPSDLADIITGCWATDPKERPTAVDVKNRLWKIIFGEMQKLNSGPQRVISPHRKTSRHVSSDGEGVQRSSGSGEGRKPEPEPPRIPSPLRGSDEQPGEADADPDGSGAQGGGGGGAEGLEGTRVPSLVSPFQKVQQQQGEPMISPFEQVQQQQETGGASASLISPFEQQQQEETSASLISPFEQQEELKGNSASLISPFEQQQQQEETSASPISPFEQPQEGQERRLDGGADEGNLSSQEPRKQSSTAKGAGNGV